jgi:hypothetical protein
MYTSDINAAAYVYGQPSGQLVIDLAGSSDVPTMLYLFREQGGTIQQSMVDVPSLTGSTQVVVPIQQAPSFRIFLPVIRK